ncbi:hypothetical protein [Bordetella muralis]|jgi:hypothetical protein|uniref:hypothetical protein n=1 Tax=Bordetella muralis TaxID=1649130 RepID=UPI0039F133B8
MALPIKGASSFISNVARQASQVATKATQGAKQLMGQTSATPASQSVPGLQRRPAMRAKGSPLAPRHASLEKMAAARQEMAAATQEMKSLSSDLASMKAKLQGLDNAKPAGDAEAKAPHDAAGGLAGKDFQDPVMKQMADQQQKMQETNMQMAMLQQQASTQNMITSSQTEMVNSSIHTAQSMIAAAVKTANEGADDIKSSA